MKKVIIETIEVLLSLTALVLVLCIFAVYGEEIKLFINHLIKQY